MEKNRRERAIQIISERTLSMFPHMTKEAADAVGAHMFDRKLTLEPELSEIALIPEDELTYT